MHRIEDKGITQQNEATSRTGEAWELLDRSTWDQEVETEASQDLDLMRENAAVHLTAAICRRLLGSPDEVSIKVVLPHLCHCSWCRGTLHETLTLCGTEATHSVYTLLAKAEEWARWEAAGKQATQAARQHLYEHGVNIVYARDGAIWEEHPDGTVERVAEVTASEISSQ